jgi:hypothetical protein
MPRLAPCLLILLPLAAAAADPAAKAAPGGELKVMPAGAIVHDLRDFMPFADPAQGKPEENLHNFSVTEGYFTGYKAEDSDGDGYLSRGDVIRIVGKLEKMLREHEPDTFAAIDTDGDEKISPAELKAYLAGKK